jgi:hypothetical protein
MIKNKNKKNDLTSFFIIKITLHFLQLLSLARVLKENFFFYNYHFN